MTEDKMGRIPITGEEANNLGTNRREITGEEAVEHYAGIVDRAG
jgi:hypothetical protein